jgi:urease accessory protein
MMTKSRSPFRSSAPVIALALAAVAAPGIASAHPEIFHTRGLAAGFSHPFTGLDHVLAMVAVGVFAARLGGRAIWLVPVSFLAMMAVGGGLGMAGVSLPFVEIGIAASVTVLGALVATRTRLPTLAALGLVGIFAVFHGYAHGAEMPADAGGLRYAAGFIAATATLHALGVAAGLGLARFGGGAGLRATQIGGTAMAAAGVGLLFGCF